MEERIKYFDAAKAGLIFLVIVGHFSKLYINDSIFLASITTFVYAFHMSAFCFISGIFFRKTGAAKNVYLLRRTLKI